MTLTASHPPLRPDAHKSSFVAHDASFADVLGASPRLHHVVDTDAHEGPVYIGSEDALYFTSLPRAAAGTAPRVDIRRLALDGMRFPLSPDRVSTLISDVNVANGMALDADGRLVVCEQGTPDRRGAIARVGPATGHHEALVDGWRGLPFNSPNDVVVKSDGTIWFTDPGYGHLQGFKPAPEVGDFVFRFDPASGRIDVVADSFDKPNGLAFSPAEDVLYVTDSGANQEAGSFYPGRPHHIEAFDVVDGRRLAGRRLFAVTAPGFPDGIKVDRRGRVYVSAFSGVLVHSPGGDLIGEIRVPDTVNFAFGGPDQNILFITADTAIWAAELAAQGPFAQGA
jgi:gluconolactonase